MRLRYRLGKIFPSQLFPSLQFWRNHWTWYKKGVRLLPYLHLQKQWKEATIFIWTRPWECWVGGKGQAAPCRSKMPCGRVGEVGGVRRQNNLIHNLMLKGQKYEVPRPSRIRFKLHSLLIGYIRRMVQRSVGSQATPGTVSAACLLIAWKKLWAETMCRSGNTQVWCVVCLAQKFVYVLLNHEAWRCLSM